MTGALGPAFRSMVYAKFRSGAELARALGWTRQKISKIMRGSTKPSVDDVMRLSRVLDERFEDVARFFCAEGHQ